MKPRNFVRLAMLNARKPAGKHVKPLKSKRRQEQVALLKAVKKGSDFSLPFVFEGQDFPV